MENSLIAQTFTVLHRSSSFFIVFGVAHLFPARYAEAHASRVQIGALCRAFARPRRRMAGPGVRVGGLCCVLVPDVAPGVCAAPPPQTYQVQVGRLPTRGQGARGRSTTPCGFEEARY